MWENENHCESCEHHNLSLTFICDRYGELVGPGSSQKSFQREEIDSDSEYVSGHTDMNYLVNPLTKFKTNMHKRVTQSSQVTSSHLHT